MKKSIPKVRERESEASILGNDREREFPLTPEVKAPCNYCTFTTVISQSHIIFKKVEDINVNIPPFPSTCMVSISEGIQAIVTSSFLKVFQAQRSQVKLKNNL